MRQLEIILGPWFEGRAAPDYERLRAYVYMVIEGQFRASDEERRDAQTIP